MSLASCSQWQSAPSEGKGPRSDRRMGLIPHNSISCFPHSLSWTVEGFQPLKLYGNTQTHIPTHMPFIHSCPRAANHVSPPNHPLPRPPQQVLLLAVCS